MAHRPKVALSPLSFVTPLTWTTARLSAALAEPILLPMQNSTTVKYARLLIAVFALSPMLLAGCQRAGAQPANAVPPPPKVTVAAVVERDVTEWDEFTGRLEAVNSVAVRPRVSGYVSAVRFDEGALVHKGDLLFEIDARPFQAEVDRLRAEVARVEATGRRAASDLERAHHLSSDSAMSPEE